MKEQNPEQEPISVAPPVSEQEPLISATDSLERLKSSPASEDDTHEREGELARLRGELGSSEKEPSHERTAERETEKEREHSHESHARIRGIEQSPQNVPHASEVKVPLWKRAVAIAGAAGGALIGATAMAITGVVLNSLPAWTATGWLMGDAIAKILETIPSLGVENLFTLGLGVVGFFPAAGVIALGGAIGYVSVRLLSR
jgi:hypothetical protein